MALPGTGSQVTGRARIRWAVTASVTGMPSWVAGMALVPLNARLQERNQHLAQGAARTPAHCHTQNQLICDMRSHALSEYVEGGQRMLMT